MLLYNKSVSQSWPVPKFDKWRSSKMAFASDEREHDIEQLNGVLVERQTNKIWNEWNCWAWLYQEIVYHNGWQFCVTNYCKQKSL